MTKEHRNCKAPGCTNLARHKGYLCTMHFKEQNATPTKPVEGEKPTAVKSKDDTILDAIVGKKEPIKSPPDVVKKLDKDGKPIEEQKKVRAKAFPASFWMMIGSLLNRAMETDAYALDKESADYLTESLEACLASGDVKLDPIWGFIGTLVAWLGFGTLNMIIEKKKKGLLGSPDKTPTKGGGESWMNKFSLRRDGGSTTKPEIAKYIQEAKETAQEGVLAQAQPAQPEPQPPVVQPMGEPLRQRYIDLEAMEKKSMMELEKVRMEMQRVATR